MTVTATIKAADAASCCPDTPGARDALLHLNGAELGMVTLVPHPSSGRLMIWGDGIDCWADSDVSFFACALHPLSRAILLADIVAAVRKADEVTS